MIFQDLLKNLSADSKMQDFLCYYRNSENETLVEFVVVLSWEESSCNNNHISEREISETSYPFSVCIENG